MALIISRGWQSGSSTCRWYLQPMLPQSYSALFKPEVHTRGGKNLKFSQWTCESVFHCCDRVSKKAYDLRKGSLPRISGLKASAPHRLLCWFTVSCRQSIMVLRIRRRAGWSPQGRWWTGSRKRVIVRRRQRRSRPQWPALHQRLPPPNNPIMLGPGIKPLTRLQPLRANDFTKAHQLAI